MMDFIYQDPFAKFIQFRERIDSPIFLGIRYENKQSII